MRNRIPVRISIIAGAAVGLYFLFMRIDYPWDWRAPWEYRRLFIWGFYNTMVVSTGAICLGFCFGVMGGLGRLSKNLIVKEFATIYVEVFRGTPLLVQVYIFYFCVGPSLASITLKS